MWRIKEIPLRTLFEIAKGIFFGITLYVIEPTVFITVLLYAVIFTLLVELLVKPLVERHRTGHSFTASAFIGKRR